MFYGKLEGKQFGHICIRREGENHTIFLPWKKENKTTFFMQCKQLENHARLHSAYPASAEGTSKRRTAKGRDVEKEERETLG